MFYILVWWKEFGRWTVILEINKVMMQKENKKSTKWSKSTKDTKTWSPNIDLKVSNYTITSCWDPHHLLKLSELHKSKSSISGNSLNPHNLPLVKKNPKISRKLPSHWTWRMNDQSYWTGSKLFTLIIGKSSHKLLTSTEEEKTIISMERNTQPTHLFYSSNMLAICWKDRHRL